ncbi:aldose epimerase family protein [Clostridium sp. HBUAS56017]|uniref:aldose epimerase family protein n=1 Tax=Clostridium sp. HBUAS56017 TaxID=2571128 RepID=UPI0011788F43|nr:aldose epimerase family protein [Clostridium sp. HBUAS56017]
MIKKEICGQFQEKPVYKYTINNKNGMKFSCISHGATLTEIYALDKNNNPVNVLLGFNNLDYYLKDTKIFSAASIGRVAGRIEKGEFEIKGKRYKVESNEGENLLHGGTHGFNSFNWESRISESNNSVTFYNIIKEEEDGFPGNIEVKITYSLNDNNDLNIDFDASSDKDTLFNPTVHSYFNLSGNFENLLRNHTLQINSDYVEELRSDNIPTGKLKEVKETPFDFREPKDLMKVVESFKKELKLDGIDHPFKVNSKNIATLISKDTGIRLDIESERNALIVYTLNACYDNFKMNGKSIAKHMAVALEPQTLPDAINHKGFGDIVLNADEKKHYNIKYHFSLA